MDTEQKKNQRNQLEKLKAQRDTLNARIQAAEARAKVSDRKKDTRRKILVGAFYLDQAQGNQTQWAELQQRIQAISGNVQIDRYREEKDASGHVTQYRVWAHR